MGFSNFGLFLDLSDMEQILFEILVSDGERIEVGVVFVESGLREDVSLLHTCFGSLLKASYPFLFGL